MRLFELRSAVVSDAVVRGSEAMDEFQRILLAKYDATFMRLLERVDVGNPGRTNRRCEHLLYDESGRQEKPKNN
jgi:hypothetical protein